MELGVVLGVTARIIPEITLSGFWPGYSYSVVQELLRSSTPYGWHSRAWLGSAMARP
jgi:hypothetical protein